MSGVGQCARSGLLASIVPLVPETAPWPTLVARPVPGLASSGALRYHPGCGPIGAGQDRGRKSREEEWGRPMTQNVKFHGIIPANLLPFHADFSIDEPDYRRHLSWLAGVAGVTAITCNGHAAEVSSLTREERQRALASRVHDIRMILHAGRRGGRVTLRIYNP